MYKGPMDKAKGGQDQGWEVGMAWMGGIEGEKWRQPYLKNSNIEKNFVEKNLKEKI